MGFPKQEYWSGLPFPPPGDLPDPGIKPTSITSLALAGALYHRCHLGYNICYTCSQFMLLYSRNLTQHCESVNSVSQFSHSVMSDSATPWIRSTPGLLVHHQLPEFTQSRPSSQWCHPAISSSVIPSSSCLLIFPSIGVSSNESVLHVRWPKYWSFNFIISPSNEYSGLISFRMDWLDLLAVQGTLKSLLQHHSSKASILGWPGLS